MHVGLPVTWQFVGNELIALLLVMTVVVRKNPKTVLWLNDHLMVLIVARRFYFCLNFVIIILM